MRRRGFTLIEVLVALGLITALSGMVFAMLMGMSERRERVRVMAADSHAATLLLDRIESDLSHCVAGRPGAAGVSGDGKSLRILSRGAIVPLDGAVPKDVQWTSYAFDEENGTLRMSRGDGWRPGSGDEIVSDRIERMTIRYYDGQGWTDSFDSVSASGLPVAIEVAIWFHRWDWRPPAADPPPDSFAAIDPAEEPFGDVESDEWSEPKPIREPDRVRVMAVPDAPAVWQEGS